MLHRASHDAQRAQPTLRLHSSRFVVESCDVFVGTEHYLNSLETFEQFENRMKAFEPQWIAFGISSRLESSLQFRPKPSLVFVHL